MKKLLAVLTVLALLFSCAGAETTAVQESVTVLGAQSGPLTVKSFPWYAGSKDAKITDEEAKMSLWFAPGAEDLPFIDLGLWTELMGLLMTNSGENPGYTLTPKIDEEQQIVTLVRENEFAAIFDFKNSRISFTDYIGFVTNHNTVYLGTDTFTNLLSSSEPYLLTITDSRTRYGEITVLNMKDYDIPMIVQDGEYLLPLQTLSFLFLAPLGLGAYFNGETAFIMKIEDMSNPQDILEKAMEDPDVMTPEAIAKIEAFDGSDEEKGEFLIKTLSESSDAGLKAVMNFAIAMETSVYPVYASVPSAPRSEALIYYSLSELCLELDCFYGLKESHSIRDFHLFFLQTGLQDNLLSADASLADKAIMELTQYWFDDGHSTYLSGSYLAEDKPDPAHGYSIKNMSRQGSAITAAREKYPNASLPYYESGDTAYVTFDGFDITPAETESGIPDYYALYQSDSLPEDTIGIIAYAHKQITRENSPIKNVVLDLSCNGGGLAVTAAYTLCWFLGEAQISEHNTFTGSESTISYLADVNMDHVCDDNDTLANRGLNLYCLISPASFSCGNLVPWGFKENGTVTLLGKVSGGGSCIVQNMNTAWGTSYCISGPDRISFTKNGSYYDVDRGVEPDHIIDSYDHFFDREALTEYIHGLF